MRLRTFLIAIVLVALVYMLLQAYLFNIVML